MIGYYIHHVGQGHLMRACALAAEFDQLGETITGLSSLPRPPQWRGPWVHLSRDDDGTVSQPYAGGVLHWAPLAHPGLRQRMAAIASWVEQTAPAAMVVDVSVEVTVVSRLLGVPTVAVVQPGERGDEPHLLGFRIADALVGFWPEQADGIVTGIGPELASRIQPVGALARFPAAAPVTHQGHSAPRGALLLGAGGHDLTASALERLRAQTLRWHWDVLDGGPAARELDVWDTLRRADVVVTHGGQNALAETAAARRPAIVIPQPRPHREQEVTAQVLAHGPWPAVVHHGWDVPDWGDLVDQARVLDGGNWASWCDGGAGARFAEVVRSVALTQPA